ncbi:MAG: GIY-YIG nuclease family protein [Bacteroidetes bacterium]|nr:GIY-YIG nuclease family protein [Bacteroidota bacterium]
MGSNPTAPTEMYTTYILQSQKTGRYYVGSTQDVGGRLIQHNTGKTRATKSGIPWEVVHTEEFGTRSEAMKKEREIKGRGSGRYLEDFSRFR